MVVDGWEHGVARWHPLHPSWRTAHEDGIVLLSEPNRRAMSPSDATSDTGAMREIVRGRIAMRSGRGIWRF